MKSIRKKVDRWLQRSLGGAGAGPALAGQSADLDQAGSRRLEIVWLIVLALVATVSVVLGYVLHAKLAAWVFAVMWGLFVGATLLIFLPQKLLITGMGSLLGVGAVDLTGADKVVERFAAAAAGILKHANEGMAGEVVLHKGPTWAFLLLLVLCCLPAYRTEQ